MPALKLFFTTAALKDKGAVDQINKQLLDLSTVLYLQFLDYVLPFFVDLNMEMQSAQTARAVHAYRDVLPVAS